MSVHSVALFEVQHIGASALRQRSRGAPVRLLTEDLEKELERFFQEVLSDESVFLLHDPSGSALTGLSHDRRHSLLVVFGDAAAAAHCKPPGGPWRVVKKPLLEFATTMLPELEDEGLWLICNPVRNLAGIELAPNVLAARLVERMTVEQRARYAKAAKG